MPTCFIAMPISTPDPSLYHGDVDHFQHVLDHLFIPAVKAAGMAPIPPLAQGADVIQAEIIKHLETADLVLCDISTLNANVFFELGIRTALNKPMCIVRDEHTPRIPFDTTIVNHHTYNSTLHAWHLDGEMNALRDHLTASLERSDGKNGLWKYFGLTKRAEPSGVTQDTDDRLALLSAQVESLIRERTNSEDIPKSTKRAEEPTTLQTGVMTKVLREFQLRKHNVLGIDGLSSELTIWTDRPPPDDLQEVAAVLAKLANYQNIRFIVKTNGEVTANWIRVPSFRS